MSFGLGVPRSGRYFTGLVIKTLSSFKPDSLIRDLRNFPDRPTNGLPVAASVRPGASPIKTTFALGFPSPGTAFPLFPTLQILHLSISLAILSNSCCLFIDIFNYFVENYSQRNHDV